MELKINNDKLSAKCINTESDKCRKSLKLIRNYKKSDSSDRSDKNMQRGFGENFVQGPIYYRLNDDNTGPELLIEVFLERGWLPWEGRDNTSNNNKDETITSSWHIWWRHSFPNLVYRKLKQTQTLNHILRANGLCRKDHLARTLHKMQHTFPTAYDFSPSTYILPSEYTKLVAEYTRILYHLKPNRNPISDGLSTLNTPSNESENASMSNIWICKPTGSSQGKGIAIFQDLHELTYGGSAVVQRYLENPLLIGGYKCDIRLYVLVTSFLPLSIYIYMEGIVRFGTEKYSLDTLDNAYSHLTNTSINKVSPGYKVEKNRIGTGCKWTLRQLRRYLKCNGQPDWLLWQKINILVTLTLLTQVGKFPEALNSQQQYSTTVESSANGAFFELYGFDILIDENLTPWLLEVNRCPSLTYDCDVDRLVKKPLLHHLFDLLGPPKVFKSIDRILKPVILNQTEDSSARKKNVCSPNVQLNRAKCKRSSLCEDSDDERSKADTENFIDSEIASRTVHHWKNEIKSSRCLRHTNKITRYVNSFKQAEKRFVIPSQNHSRRHKSTTCITGKNSKDIVAEEACKDTYIPLAQHTTFQTLRNQFMTNCSLQPTRNLLNLSSWGSLSSLESIGRPLSNRPDKRPQHRQPSRCGDWIRTFPFNATTLHGSKDHVYLRSLVAEIMKLRKQSEKLFNDSPSANEEYLNNQMQKLFWRDHFLWMPKSA